MASSDASANEEVGTTVDRVAAALARTSLAETLSFSDGHANILLTTTTTTDYSVDSESGTDNEQQGVLKLTFVSNFEHIFGNRPGTRYDQQRLKMVEILSNCIWKRLPGGGTQRSFHEVFYNPRVPSGDGTSSEEEQALPGLFTGQMIEPIDTNEYGPPVFKAEFIYPASKLQVARAQREFAMFTETPAIYRAVTKPFIDEILASDIVPVKVQREYVLLNREGNSGNGGGWSLNVASKWRSHPDAEDVPRDKWYMVESTADLYCLGIAKEDSLSSLRDLRGEHLPVLREMLTDGPAVIEDIYGVQKDQLRVFVQYQPDFYRFHVHYTRLTENTGAQVERAHLLEDIIQSLEDDPMCFTKRSLTFKLCTKEKLYERLKAHEGVGDGQSST